MAERSNFTLGSGGSDGTGGDSKPSGDGGTTPLNSGAIDPAALAGGSPAGTGDGSAAPKRGRGRPKGSGSGSAKATPQSSIDVGSIETLLFNIHGMLALATGIEELSLAQSEANNLAKAVANVQQYYPMHISAKAMAWSNLVMVAGSVYGSRIVAVAMKPAKESPQPQQERPPAPSPFNPVIIPGR